MRGGTRPEPCGSGGRKGRLWTSKTVAGSRASPGPAPGRQAGRQRAGRAGAQRFIGNTSRGGGGGGGGGRPRAGCGAAVLRRGGGGPGPPQAYVSVSPLVTCREEEPPQPRPAPGPAGPSPARPAARPHLAHPGLDVLDPALEGRQLLVQGGQPGPARHVCGEAAVRDRGRPPRPATLFSPGRRRPHRRS